MFFGRAGGVGMRADGKYLLRAFVALCEIHWRSFWLWRGGAAARDGRGFGVAGPSVSRSGCHLPIVNRWRGIGVFPTFRHAELVSASYLLAVVGIKILKQVQDDG